MTSYSVRYEMKFENIFCFMLVITFHTQLAEQNPKYLPIVPSSKELNFPHDSVQQKKTNNFGEGLHLNVVPSGVILRMGLLKFSDLQMNYVVSVY